MEVKCVAGEIGLAHLGI